jgi:SAM-dependent methyltransferase
MTCTINNIYPWGRTFDEYQRMFALTDADLDRRILGCADGPASFNATMHRMGRRVVSVDPLYRFGADEIRARVEATYPIMLAKTTDDRERFVWDEMRSPEALAELRLSAMRDFLDDFDVGRREGRYLTGSLPTIDLPDDSFDLALCSHYLFLYTADVSYETHLASIREMTRIAREVRIFPLLDMVSKRSAHLDPIIAQLRSDGFHASIERVAYEFLRGANEMLRIS